MDLRLAAPDRHGPEITTPPAENGRVPAAAERFVGRTGVLARSSAALALQRRAGRATARYARRGKTACAVELAYGHEHAFERLVWYQAPDDGMPSAARSPISRSRWSGTCPVSGWPTYWPATTRWPSSLPRLTELAERRRVLIVIDNAESLLTESGQWRDDRWGLSGRP